MSRRERVAAPLNTASAAQHLQPPWQEASPSAAQLSAGQQQQHPQEAEGNTDIKDFAASSSPVPDSQNSSREAGNVDQADGRAAQLQKSSAVELLGSVKQQLGHPKDSHPLLRQQPLKTSEQRQARHRHKAGTADIHLIGEITGAVGFGAEPLYCTWQLVYDEQLWGITKGLAKGRTHASSPVLPEEGGVAGVVWEAPLDMALTTTSSQHWPAIVFKLFHRSLWLGRDEFVGYSLCSLPSTPGCHHVSCPVWAAVEARRGFMQELTSWFTGLTPQLVDESFITDLEQRYEQGQHLHTRDCSSSRASLASARTQHAPAAFPAARAVERIAGATPAPGMQCRSFGAAAASSTSAAAAAGGGLVGAGGRICLRLHVLARGLHLLRQTGGDSVGACLERLRDTVEKMRSTKEVAAADDEEVESAGVRLVREGRAARLAAVQQHMADGSSNRDQQLLEARGTSSYGGGLGAGGYSGSGDRATFGRLSPGRNTPRGFGSRDGRASSVAGSTSSMNGAEGISADGGTSWQPAAEAAGGSPARFSRAGRLGSSPNRTAGTVPSGRTTADRDSRLSIRAAAATPGSRNQSGVSTPDLSSYDASEAQRTGGSRSSGAAVAGAVARRQPGQHTPLMAGRAAAAAAASPSEQQGLWEGARSAPEEAAAPAAGARGLLLRRGAQLQLEPISTSSGSPGRLSTGSTEGGRPAASPNGSETAGAPLLPYGADSSTR